MQIYMYSDIEIHQNVHSKLTKQMFDRLLHLMASLVKNAPVNTSIRISSSGDQPSRYTGLELRQRRQLAGTSDILAYYHSQIIAALQGGQPPYHVFPIIFDIFDTHYISLKQWSNTYDKDNATQRRLLALNGNYVALLMSGLAQYLLLQPNTRDRQRHYTLTDVNTARVMVLQRRPGIWRNLLQALDSRVEPRVNPQPDSDTEDGATQEQRLDPALWCSIKQASVELRLAFARAAFVVGDSESMLKENHGQDRDPIADIRETSMLRGGARQDRLEAATKHIHNAWVDRGEVRSYVDQLRTAEERSLVLRWLKRYDPMFGKVQAVVNELAGNQARKIRHEGEWSRRRMSTRMPKPKSTTTTARIRPAMLDASKKEDLELLINVRHRETFGDSSWYYY
ncbi:hypothetical protein PMZ80_001601 [Knufia obscura]|uniref:Uncharacterized protein n=2 Tax=Knufia TaxID=430999 RepID=A0AAN8F354_9EURO|nr:hypothetical protein PMZ80_001601 [Knufia obscura]KAK5955573.1 hypothetical protein OHC33_003214 [Knufia fluminis]